MSLELSLEKVKKEIDELFEFAKSKGIKKCSYGIDLNAVEAFNNAKNATQLVDMAEKFIQDIYSYAQQKYEKVNIDEGNCHIFFESK